MSDDVFPDEVKIGETTYCLRHLQSRVLNAEVGHGVVLRVRVIYSDHCFTESRFDDDGNLKAHCNDPAFHWRSTVRPDGYFSVTRYEWSKKITRQLETLFNNNYKVCYQKGEGNAARFFLWGAEIEGQFYFIVFTIVKTKNPDYDLTMRISSAYPLPTRPVFSLQVRFRLLMEKRMKNEAISLYTMAQPKRKN